MAAPVETVSADRARALGLAVLRAAGAPPVYAARQTAILVEGDLRGRPSHGMQRLPTLVARIANGVLNPAAAPALTWPTSAILQVDGHGGFGPVAAEAAILGLEAAAQRRGVAVAAIRNAGHLGMLAPYLEGPACRGFVALGLTTSEALVHPAGGRRAMLGTNPIGIAIPAAPHPFVLDMSTGAIATSEIIAHRRRGEELQPGLAIDADGHPTTDPARALEGAISPFGGSKGYGLGLAFELLVALLTGTALGDEVRGTLDTDELSTKGDVFILLNPQLVAGPGGAAEISHFLTALRATPPAPGIDQVRIPGDRMREDRTRRLKQGIAYPRTTWHVLVELEARASSRSHA